MLSLQLYVVVFDINFFFWNIFFLFLCSPSVSSQVQNWGSVEWHHDIEHQDLRSRLAAAQLLAELVNFEPSGSH